VCDVTACLINVAIFVRRTNFRRHHLTNLRNNSSLNAGKQILPNITTIDGSIYSTGDSAVDNTFRNR
jgi:hypothetical protein